MGQSRQKRLDKLSNGIAGGILLPLTFLLIIYLFRYSKIPFSQFIYSLSEMKILIKLLSLGVFFNLLLFFYFYRKGMDKAAKGVIAATFIYGLLALVSRFF